MKRVRDWGIVWLMGTVFRNWFAAPMLDVGQASYWNMYGVLLLLSIFQKHPAPEDERWKKALTLIAFCVPETKKDEANEALETNPFEQWYQLASIYISQAVGLPQHSQSGGSYKRS